MANILGSLSAAARTLGAFQQGLAVTQNNIGNASTPGFARQRAIFEALPFVVSGGQSGGVAVNRIESIRDKFLDFQVVAALQRKVYSEKLAQTLGAIEPSFPLTGDLSVGATMDQFFNSFNALSASPGDFNLRQGVLQSAAALANAIRTTFTGLTNERASLDQEAGVIVNRINDLTAEIAKLNAAKKQEALTGETSATDTRLTQVLEELGSLVDFREVQQQDGALSLVLSNGAVLASGSSSFALKVLPGESRLTVQDSQGNDVTSGIQGGQLGAILTARNTNIARYLANLNQLAGTVADSVNEQLSQGHDLAGLPGKPLFQYSSAAFTGAGRTAGTLGASTPAPPVSVTVDFTGGVTGSITAALDSFFVAAGPPAGLANGDTVTVNFTSADGSIRTSITTAPLSAGDSTATIAVRLNDQIALNPALAGKVSFADQGGSLKLTESDTVGQGFSFTASTNDPGFTSGLEAGGKIGGQSAQEIADALNAQAALNSTLADAGVRFAVVGGPSGQVRVDASAAFDATVTDFDAGTGFVSGLAGTFSAGGSPVAATFALTGLGNREIAASGPSSADGNENALAIAGLASSPIVGGFTPNQFYAKLTSQLGADASQADTSTQTQNQILLEAQNLRDSLSGVSLDEEATHLVEFQKAYEATARVVTVLDSLAETLVNLLR